MWRRLIGYVERVITKNLQKMHLATKYDMYLTGCWFSQQCVEKAIKGALTLDNISFKPIHNLDELATLLPEIWNVKHSMADLLRLSSMVVSSRYADTRYGDPTKTDADRALRMATDIFETVEEEFRRRDVL